jgi:hypothetical protein
VSGAAGRCLLEPSKGVVVVTRFDCGTLWRLILMRVVHVVLGRRIRRGLDGLLFTSTITDVGSRRVISVSAFGTLDDLYQMGSVADHIKGAHLVARLKLRTSGGIFPYGGDWRHILFGAPGQSPSPLSEYAGPRKDRPPVRRTAASSGPDGRTS